MTHVFKLLIRKTKTGQSSSDSDTNEVAEALPSMFYQDGINHVQK